MSAEVDATKADPTTEPKAEEVKPVDTTMSDDKDATEASAGADKDDDKDTSKHATADEIDARFTKERKGGDRNGDDRRSGHRGGNRGNRGGNQGRGNYNNQDKFDRRNVKSRYDDQEKTDDPAQIRKQVEFYFSDTNLRQDKFLFEKVQGSKNEPVDIKIIASFKRMQRFQPYTAIVNALKESTIVNVLNGDKPNDEQVQRKEPLPEDLGTNHREVAANYAQQSMHRSIYAKGFGKEDSKTQLKIEELFSMWGVTAVRLRRLNDGYFKGSAFIEFPSEDEMQQFLELDEESKPKWEGEPLKIMSKKAYCEQKDKDINEGKIRPNDQDDYSAVRSGNRDNSRGRGRGRGGRGRGRGNYDREERGDRRRRSSRSRSHDLREDDWKELRKRDNKRDGKKDKDDEKRPQQEFEENGIPKIMSTVKDTAVKAKDEVVEKIGEVAEGVAKAANGTSKKRAAEDDAAPEKETKKVKEGLKNEEDV